VVVDHEDPKRPCRSLLGHGPILRDPSSQCNA